MKGSSSLFKMKLLLTITTIVCFHFVAHCKDPKDEVEIIPEAVEKERATIKLFWALMYEVCKTFCVWRKVCKSFCERFNPDKNPDFEKTFGLISAPSSLLVSQDSMAWFLVIVTKICEDDSSCIEKCLNMDSDNETNDWNTEDENPAHILRALYQMSKSYFAQCAKINGKSTVIVDTLTIDQFCKEITAADRILTEECLLLLN